MDICVGISLNNFTNKVKDCRKLYFMSRTRQWRKRDCSWAVTSRDEVKHYSIHVFK